MPQHTPVAIIGAGLAGLNAAYQLHKAGCRAQVFEASARVGGRVWTDQDSHGARFERGGEFINEEHTELRSLAAELGVTLQSRYTEAGQTAPTVGYQCGDDFYTAQGFAEGVQPLVVALTADRDTAWDSCTAEDYLAGLAGLRPWVRDMIALFLEAEFGLDLDRQPAGNLWALRDVRPERPSPVSEGYARYTVADGSEALTRALAGRVESALALDRPLTAVRTHGSRFALSFDGQSDDVMADCVILALPFSTLRRVALDGVPLSPAKRRAIRELDYATNGKIVMGYAADVVRARPGLSEVFSRDARGFIWPGNRRSAMAAMCVTIYRGGAAGASLNERTVRDETPALVAALDRAYPGSASVFNGSVTAVNWASHPWALGSYSCFTPGQETDFGDTLGRPEGRLLFAGEHTSREFRCFMNGAAESGRAAARLALVRREA